VARIAGVNIPTQKRVEVALRYIHGIGPAKAKEICKKVGIADDRRVHDLTDSEVIQIRETIDRDYLVEGDLRREVAMNIKRLMDLGCYRACATAGACRSAASARIRTLARAKGPAKAMRARKKSRK